MAQVTTGPTTTKKHFHLARDLAISLTVIIAVAAFFIGWFAGSHHTKGNSEVTNTGLITYINHENGFKFDYPVDWGALNYSSTDISGTKHYVFTFSKSPIDNIKYSIVLSMDWANPKNTSCNSNKQCFNPNAVTKTNILDVIKNMSSKLTINDSSSYAVVNSLPNQKTDVLTASQIVSLNKQNISAATINYQIYGASGCTASKFSDNPSSHCITKSDYDVVNKVLKSIRSI